METLHHLNILLHATAGSLALIAGLLAIGISKTSKKHILTGRLFMKMLIIVIITGLIGVFVFRRNNFLLVITLLAGYNCFSGIRTIRLQGKKPAAVDYTIPVMVIASAMYYLYYLRTSGLYWSPVITYSTVGALLVLTTYDLSKAFLPTTFLKKAMIYEHIYKMVSAFSGILSAFTGTVLPQYKPWSQFLPSVTGFTFIMITFIAISYKPLYPQKNAR